MLDRLIEVLAWYGGIMIVIQAIAYTNDIESPEHFIAMGGIGWGLITLFGALFYIPNVMILEY